MSFPTGDRNLDLRILANLSFNERQKLCSTDSYTNALCHSDEFWWIKLEGVDLEEYQHISDSPVEIYYYVIKDKQALERFHNTIIMMDEMDLTYQEMHDRWGIEFTINITGKDNDEFNLYLRQKQTAPGAGNEVARGNVNYNVKTRQINGNMSVVGFNDEIWPAKSVIQNYFTSENVQEY